MQQRVVLLCALVSSFRGFLKFNLVSFLALIFFAALFSFSFGQLSQGSRQGVKRSALFCSSTRLSGRNRSLFHWQL